MAKKATSEPKPAQAKASAASAAAPEPGSSAAAADAEPTEDAPVGETAAAKVAPAVEPPTASGVVLNVGAGMLKLEDVPEDQLEEIGLSVSATAERGRWRAGLFFPRGERTIPLAELDAEKLKALQGDPMLVLAVVPLSPAKPDAAA